MAARQGPSWSDPELKDWSIEEAIGHTAHIDTDAGCILLELTLVSVSSWTPLGSSCGFLVCVVVAETGRL